MADHAGHRIADLTRKLTAHADLAARAILTRQPGDPIDRPATTPTGRSSSIPRPVEMRSIDWTDAQLADTRRLTHLLTGHERLPVLGAAQIAERLDQPITGYDLDQLTDTLTGPEADPARTTWRIAVHHLSLAWHEASSAIHDGWTELHASRHVIDSRGLSVLDQTAEAAALDWLPRLTKLEQHLHGLVRRVTPAKLRLCACGCRRPLEPDARRPTRDDCQKRLERERSTARANP